MAKHWPKLWSCPMSRMEVEAAGPYAGAVTVLYSAVLTSVEPEPDPEKQQEWCFQSLYAPVDDTSNHRVYAGQEVPQAVEKLTGPDSPAKKAYRPELLVLPGDSQDTAAAARALRRIMKSEEPSSLARKKRPLYRDIRRRARVATCTVEKHQDS
nr:hypothetical protein CFP56_28684 [Quercus suber]